MSDSSFIEYLRHEANNRTDKDWQLLLEDNTVATVDKDFPPELYDGGHFRKSGTVTNSKGENEQYTAWRWYSIRKDSYTKTVEEHIEEYNNGEMEERFLWSEFGSHFWPWSEEWFNKVEKPALIILRDTLRSRGVYVNQTKDVANALYNTLIAKDPLKWPDDDAWSMKANYRRYEREFQEIDEECTLSEKFGGHETDLSFEFSSARRMFIYRCKARGVPQQSWHLGFNIMLKGPPLTYYRETLSGRDLTFSKLCRKLVYRYGLDKSVLKESD
ncbi:hypothetical protein HYFRA_00001948 [Hymenoscyphus fraxineus]|uniref:Uncharacterized protein n=1 Tax=Hymenoscyphus fraxineus TaxID=746836 RepID=A0A9N9KMR8_9HELO|nr:hypothetical protein HYFRA_00001948 [Hymenoscyphus fraxineus]